MSGMDISSSGLSAQRMRLDMIANNIANAETTRTSEGGPYQRLQTIFSENSEDGGVQVSEIIKDPTPARKVYDPGHPDADAQGFVNMPNVNVLEEMVDLVSATRAYEANVTALNADKGMTRKALEIGRG